MSKTTGIALLIVCLPMGCDAGNGAIRSTNSQSTPDAGISSCDPSTDYLKCDGKNVLSCTCTKQGAAEGTDITGRPRYACDAFSWVLSSTCAVACDTSISPSTACIASTQPVPECANDGPTCWNGNLTYCTKGYPLPTTPCAAGTQCALVPGCGALCLGDRQATDPRCSAGGSNSDFCADNTAYHCACGYLIGSEVCGPAPHNNCVTAPGSASDLFATCGLPP